MIQVKWQVGIHMRQNDGHYSGSSSMEGCGSRVQTWSNQVY